VSDERLRRLERATRESGAVEDAARYLLGAAGAVGILALCGQWPWTRSIPSCASGASAGSNPAVWW